MGFLVVFGVRRGPQLGPSQQTQLDPTLRGLKNGRLAYVTWYSYIVSYSRVLFTIGNKYSRH